MTTVDDRPATVATTETFDSLNPRTGEVIATYPVHGEAEVAAAVELARYAAGWWSGLTFKQRATILRQWKSVMTRRMHQLGDVVAQETGKPHTDAVLEIVLAIDHLEWAAKNAGKVLGRQRVSPGMVMSNQKATVEYLPLGVIGVIGPWNYPVFTPLGSISYALAAGNTVVFKPSEYTPGVGQWLVDSLAEVTDAPILQLITGLGATGAALCQAGVDKVAFTGSAATGKKVMAACADTLTPVIIEGGGKDSIIVDADADVDAASDAAVWGAFSNAGQTCIGVERAYVHEAVYDDFVSQVVAKAKKVTAHEGPDSHIGPMTMPSAPAVIRSHIEDALARGGRAVLGGLEAVGERFVQPTVLVDVPESSRAIKEETFGPTMTISKVSSMTEAVARTNDTEYGLGSTVFSRSGGVEIAEKIRSGMTSVNGFISYAGIANLPFGGVGGSGFGRIHGPDGLKEFTYAKSITVQRWRAPVDVMTFSRTKKAEQTLEKIVTLLHGGNSLFGKK